jgi:N-acetylmuramic acid 6-phosphate etherase
MIANNSTESSSIYNDLEKMSILELLTNINQEDLKVAFAVQKEIESIEKLVAAIVLKMKNGGRLFYIGAGTSGRLGIVDASECPPTFGVPHDLVIGLIAGGDQAIRKAVEFAEDDIEQGWKDLLEYNINENDSLIGIAASGKTPYVLNALTIAKQHGILTGCITNNVDSLITKVVDFPIAIQTGPEFITGSTRMKAGTSQKLVLNMISTTVMIQLGRVKGNKMVDMQLSNNKLIDRGTKMIMEALNIQEEIAASLLNQFGSVRKAIEGYQNI